MSQSYFKDKVAIVTGSSMGIGKSIAMALGAQGAKVVLNGRNTTKLNATLTLLKDKGLDVIAVPGDVSQWKDCQHLVKATIEEFGQLDILINNAGVATRGGIEKMAPEVFQQVMDVNVLGSIFPSKAALPYLRNSKGSVIFISSIASFHGLPYNSIYCASKKALTAFSESLRLEVKADGIHVGVSYVGFTENDPKKIIMDADGKLIYLDQRKGIKKQSPEQVARIVLRQIKRRKKTVTLSVAGKFLKIMEKYFPFIVDKIYASRIETIRANSEGTPNYVS